MFLSFTPNPCIERTLRVSSLALHQSHRIAPDDVRVSAGGKGLNAARVAANFGAKTVALAPVGRFERAHLEELLQNNGVQTRLIETGASTRTSMNIIDESGSTEFVEAGNALSLEDGTRILEAWRELIPTCELALVGGSYPHFVDEAWNAHATILCSLARAAGKKLIYDGKGEPFRRAVFSKSPPWCIKPNLDEMRELWRRDIETPVDERRAIRDLLSRGIELVLLSCGARGLYVGFQGQIEFLSAPKVKEVSAVGSGDSLVGAFAARFLESSDVWESARLGAAAGAANAARFDVAQVGPDDAAALLPNVKRQIAEIGLMTR